MKIKSIYISAFGGLKDYRLDLSDGFNVILGDNEDGKTTVMTFIKCMFYGTGNSSKKGGVNGKTREKYTPWDGSLMGGRILFSDKGVNYSLEREFRKSNSSDRISLINLDTGEELPAGSSVGETFFMLNSQAFERSVFIDNEVSFGDDEGAEADLNAKLSNIAVSGDTDVTEKDVLKRLTDARYSLLKISGTSGSLYEDRKSLNELKEKLIRSENDAKRQSEIAERLRKLKSEYELYEKEYAEAKKICDSESNIKNAHKLKQYLELKDELDRLTKSLTDKSGEAVSPMFIDMVTKTLDAYQKHIDRANTLKEEIDRLKEILTLEKEKTPDDLIKEFGELEGKIKGLEIKRNAVFEEIKQKSEEIKSAEKETSILSEKAKKVNTPLLLLGIGFAVIAVLTLFFTKIVYFPIFFGILTLVFSILGITVKSNKKFNAANENLLRLKQEYNDLQEAKNAVSEEKTEALSKLSLISASVETQRALVGQREDDINSKTELYNAEFSSAEKSKNDVIAYFSKYKSVSSVDEIKEEMKHFSEIFDKQKLIKSNLTMLSKDLDGISYEQAKEKLERIDSEDDFSEEVFAQQKQKAEMLIEKQSEVREKISSLETELKTGFTDFVTPETVKREISVLSETVGQKEAYCTALDTAISVLKEGALSMRKTYGSALNSEMLKIFSELTNGKYSGITMLSGFNLKAEKSNVFGMHDIDYLSKGTVNGAYLSVRLAISSLLSKDTPLPVIMDDALSQFDDTRLKTALKYFADFSKQNQTVLFTCHGDTFNIAKELGADCKLFKQ